MSRFPRDFVWGAATAAAQIEGAAHEDGKRDSVWDAFARVPGAVTGGDTPEVAVDHYHRYAQDVAIMRELGLHAYRFSVSWARVRPDGGAPNPAGIAFYSRLVDALLEAGVTPFLTLYHWDLPQAIQAERGGWTDRDTAERFADYALTVHDALGDRVRHWTTFNEPWCSSMLGYASGEHAPGHRNPAEALAALHHQHLAHGLAVQALRSAGAKQIGIAPNLTTAVPRDPDDPVDLDAARRIDGLFNRMYLEPVLLGRYPEDVLADLAAAGHELPVRDGDLATIRQPIDFLGVNHYHDDQVSGHATADDARTAAPGREYGSPYPGSEFVTFPGRGLPRTAMGWEINPRGLTQLLVRLGHEYGDALPPLYITENGAAYDDIVTGDGLVHDAQRTEFILEHVAAVADAIEQGADVRGYFVWSLLDNFEWAWGYGERFGIVRVDYDSLERTVKDSGRAYADLIAAESAARG